MSTTNQAEIDCKDERRDKRQMVLFLDGTSGIYFLFSYSGPALSGEPTAYVIKNDEVVWVSPGESVSWIEHPLK